MGMRYSVLVLSALVVAACSDTVKLRNEKTGKEVTCGGEMLFPGRPPTTDRCVKLMERAGYKKVEEEH